MNVAVIGVGNIGKHHARVYSSLRECRLAAVCDVNEAAGKEAASRFGAKLYRDYVDMLDREPLDAVSIAVPTAFHRKVTLDCIARGKHVLVEKPLADTVESAREIIAAARKKGVVLTVGHVERFNPAVRRLREMIRGGELGKVTTIMARRVGTVPPQIRDSNVVVDTAIHDIDILNYLIGREPTRVQANSGRAILRERDDYADILLKYDGTNGFIQVNWITPVKIRRLAVTGTKGYAELNYITQELVLYRSDYRPIDDFSDVVKFGTPKKVSVSVKRGEPLELELRSFLAAAASNGKPEVTGEDGLKALEIAMKIIRCSGGRPPRPGCLPPSSPGP
jgi:UDP-N-acetylglucosamine 3-dehydrogenase